MNEEPTKVCVNCGAEYSLEAVTCADCGGNLVFPPKHEEGSVPPEYSGADTLIRQGLVDYLEEVGELLRKNGIRSDIRFHGCAPGT